MQKNNPFKVKSPEKISADETVSLFVNVFNDFPEVLIQGDSFVNGPRGSGKSMMFRYMLPDAQSIIQECPIAELEYYACYIPIKATNFDKMELNRLKEQAQHLINEHILTTHIAIRFISSLIENQVKFADEDFDILKSFVSTGFKRILRRSGCKSELKLEFDDINDLLRYFQTLFEDMHYEASDYCNRIGFKKDDHDSYEGSLCNYLHFLYPLLSAFGDLKSIPKNIYLLFDDADNLNIIQKKVLNSWVFYRLGTNVSLKISTQMRYNVYLTMSGHTIDSPHDYSEVNISTVYTSSKDKYKQLIKGIIAKRLADFQVEQTDPKVFFPDYKKQEDGIAKIYAQHIKNFDEGKARGNKKYDDANRYSRPDYIRSLKGTRKQGSSYYYSGLDQLIHLSSGIVRYFLEASAKMFSEMLKETEGKGFNHISCKVQNDVARKYANEFLFDEFEKHSKVATSLGYTNGSVKNLQNLINGLGGLFSSILLSDASERRVFSIAISNDPAESVSEVLDLAVRLGYFQISTIGNKEGTGRTRLYIMNRRLAPVFTLDPTSFAGYKFLRSEHLELAMLDPNKFVREMKKKIKANPDEDLEINEQLELF